MRSSRFLGVLLLMSITVLSCIKDDSKPSSSDLDISDLIELIPLELQEERTAVFIDNNGLEKHLRSSTIENESIVVIEDEEFTGKRVSYELRDENDFLVCLISVFPTSVTGNDPRIEKALSVSLIPGYNVGGRASAQLLSFYYKDNGFRERFGSTMFDRIDLLNREFENVYFTDEFTTDEYAGLYFNFETGLVAFRDRENILWTFDHWED